MPKIEVNKHAEVIKGAVYHTFPYNQLIPNFKGPHADDCPGCIIEAEVKMLVAELDRLSPVDKIIAELEQEKEARKLRTLDRQQAFEKAGVVDEGSVTDLVTSLVIERDTLVQIIKTLRDSINATANLLNDLNIDQKETV